MCVYIYIYIYIYSHHTLQYKTHKVKCYKLALNFVSFTIVVYDVNIQGDSWLVDITAGGDFLGLCDQKS